MKVMKKIILAGIAVLLLAGTTITAFAGSEPSTAAEIVAELTGRELQSVIDEKNETGKTYGAIANEAGLLKEFSARLKEMIKLNIANRVAEGKMTKEQADAAFARIEARYANCDGEGYKEGGTRLMNGSGFGQGAGKGAGQDRGQGEQSLGKGAGQGLGKGAGQGRGSGNGLGDGSCALNP